MIGTIDKKNDAPSLYKPSKEVRDFTGFVKQDYQSGWDNLHTPFEELNDMTVIDRMNLDQRTWNSYTEEGSNDPDEAWRWRGIRPITRSKILSIAAHSTAQIMIPEIFAQNDEDEEDKMLANVMRWMMKWNIKESNYEQSFLFAVIGALVNPVTFLQADYFEIMQTIKERGDNGEITEAEVLDEVMSGLQMNVLGADEVMVTNAYEFNHQKQKAVIRTRYIEYDDAKALYGGHEDFEVVSPGQETIFDAETGLFYDQFDEDLPTLVKETTYYNRREDTQVAFIGGVYLGDSNVDANPMKHRDNRNAPKYPQAKTGYEPIDTKKFYYYKSAVNKLAHDQQLVDRMWQMRMDGTFLETMPPQALFGDGHVDSSVFFPGKVTSFGQDDKMEAIKTGGNLNATDSAIADIERSMAQSSISDVQSASGPSQQGTAFVFSQLQQNANTELGLFGKMLAPFVLDVGGLMMDNILQHQTIAEVEEITGGNTRLKFRTFLVPDEKDGGKKVTRKIRFSEELMGRPMTDKQVKKRERALRNESDKIGDTRIYDVNPEKFQMLKYKLSINPDNMLPKNKAFEKVMNLEAYDRMIVDPVIGTDPEAMTAVTRDFLVSTFAEGDADKYLPKDPSKVLGMDLSGGDKKEAKTSAIVNEAAGNGSVKRLMNKP